MSVIDEIFEDGVENKIFSMKADLMIDLRNHIDGLNLNQKDVAENLYISQPRLSSLINGDIHAFSLEMLIKFALRLGLNVKVEVGVL